MLKLPVWDFADEVMVEINDYGEEELAVRWESEFQQWMLTDKAKKTIKEGNIVLKDEEELFHIVDRYISAIADGKSEEYWISF